jgi:DNA mismatch endonuclease (patch repair protein)
MRANGRVSGAEVRFRRALWAEGARGFTRGERLPGRPDVVFPAVRMAVFVHGCYWHRCPACDLRDPKANADFWRSKFDANLRRDAGAVASLVALGWDVQIVWEHEIRAEVQGPTRRIAALVAARRRL